MEAMIELRVASAGEQRMDGLRADTQDLEGADEPTPVDLCERELVR